MNTKKHTRTPLKDYFSYSYIKWKLKFLFPSLLIVPRILFALRYYNYKYIQILKWAFHSRENTNFTYDITERNILYLAHTISVVYSVPVALVLNYIKEVEKNTILFNHIRTETQRSIYRYEADKKGAFGRRLGWYAVARILKPRLTVETGIDKGHGAVLLCSALEKNKLERKTTKKKAKKAQKSSTSNDAKGYLGIDINLKAGYLLSGRYTEYGKIIYSDAIKAINNLKNGSVDLYINDSDHSKIYEYKEYLAIKAKLSSRAIILGDNSEASDSLARFSLENKRKFIFFQEVPKDHWYPGGGIGISYK